MSMLAGEELIGCLCDPATDPDDAPFLAGELLREFTHGFPICRLRDLLCSANETAVRSGAWIASELAAQASPLVGEIDRLLEHEDRCVRFFAVGAVLGGAARGTAATIAKAIGRVQDRDKAVRWKTLHLLSNATREQLRASLPYLDVELRAEVEWLCSNAPAGEIGARLAHGCATARLVAVVAADRLCAVDPSPLRQAAFVDDSEVRSFAGEQLSHLQIRQPSSMSSV